MSASPERTLWQEVLLRQVDDALHGPAGVSGFEDRRRVIEDARRFLSRVSNELETLCLCAGLEVDAVISAMHKRIADAPTAAELAANRKASRASLLRKPRQSKPKLTKYVDRLISFNGSTLTMQQWADRTGLTVSQIASRLNNHWTVERALTQPVGKRNCGWGATGAAGGTDGPGVGSDFRGLEGTGGGRSAQDRPKISFSGKEAS